MRFLPVLIAAASLAVRAEVSPQRAAENIVFDNVDVSCKVMVKNVKPLVVRASALEIVETATR